MEDPVQTFFNGSLAYQLPEQIPLMMNNNKEKEEEDQEEEVGLRRRQSNGNRHVNGQEKDPIPSSYFDQGSESMDASSTSEENDDAKDVVDSEIQKSPDQNAESLSPVIETFKQQDVVDSDSKPVDIETRLVDDAEFADLADQEELTEFDVETVLEKQNTHHLYCPNCRSCITRKVILRRRKPKVKSYKPKRDVPRTVFHSDLEQPVPVDNGISSNDGADHRHSDRSNAFKCLSCFSIFVPTGNGFKLFRCFGESSENENIQSYQQKEPLATTSWFYSIFVPEKKTVTADIGQASVGTTEFDRTNSYSSSNGTLVKKRETEEEANCNPPPLSGLAPVNSSAVQYIFQDIPASETGHEEEASNATKGKEHIASQNGLTSSVPLYSSVGNSYQVKLVNEGRIRPGEGENDISAQDGIFSGSVSTNVDGQLDIIVEKNDTGGAAVKFSVSNTTQQLHLPIDSPDRVPANFIDPLQTLRGDVILTVGTGTDESKPSVTTIASVAEVSPPNVSRGRDADEWEIVKSIVYGGLIESITSLSVVSSAAGAGASTLNILVFGLANLFGGLPLFFHNLRDLKKESFRGVLSATNEHEDHYQQVLGHRKNFSFHLTLAVLSFLVFGLLPPVVFAFSFRKSNDKDFKLATVAVASFACITILSIAKAFVQRPRKSYMKTVTYYLSIAVAASGAAYLAGDLIEKLLEKLQPGSTLDMPFAEMRQSAKPWTSY